MARFLRLSLRARILTVGAVVVLLVLGVSVGVAVTRHQGSPAGGVIVTPSSRATATAPVSPSTSQSPAPAPACAAVPGGPPPATFAANYAVALAFAPDGRLFYAERGGAVRVVEAGAVKTFASVSTVTSEPGGGYSERGLLGLSVSPTFAADHYVYGMYDLPDYSHEDVVRWTDCGGVGTAMVTLIEFPSGSDCCHKGGRLAFGTDHKLYVTLGEEHTATVAQNLHDVRGKVLRYNPDGSVPVDNPFGAGDPVWSYGLRNPFGIAFSSDGTLLVTNNGPSGDAGSPGTGYDTADTITRGSGHQWPLCYGYSHPIGQNAGCGGQIGPDWSSETETLVPTGATFVDAAGPAPYAGHFVFCTFEKGMRVLSLGLPHATTASGPAACALDVKEGPDHTLYYSDTGHVYRAG